MFTRVLFLCTLGALASSCESPHPLALTAPESIGTPQHIVEVRYKLSSDPVGQLGNLFWNDETDGCANECRRFVPATQEVVLKLEPDLAADFIGWSGVCAGQGTTCRFVPGTNQVVAAELRRVAAAVQILSFNQEEGVVVSSPPGITCGLGKKDCAARFPRGAKVLLFAFTGAPYFLEYWSPPCSDQNRTTCAVTLDNVTLQVEVIFDQCSAPSQLCNGRCVDVASDPLHCGACCNSCGGIDDGQYSCVSGKCSCADGKTCTKKTASCAPLTSCGACGCSDLNGNDDNNCGGCGLTCALGKLCTAGKCQ